MQNYKDSKEKPLNNFTLAHHLLFLMRSPKKRRGALCEVSSGLVVMRQVLSNYTYIWDT